MKSSTLRRSNLSKERMLVLEELAKSKKQPYDAAPGVYVRANKEKELNVLWQNFRVNQKEEKSPGIYLTTGFIAGAITMLAITTLVSFSLQGNDSLDLSAPTGQPSKEKARLTFIPADKKSVSTDENASAGTPKGSESYTVKNGDTLAAIIIRFYGNYDVSKIEKIKQANHLSNPNNLKLGQNLIIPMD